MAHPSSWSLLGLGVGGSDNPWRVVRGLRELLPSLSCFSLNALPRLGGLKTLSKIFHRWAVSSAVPSLPVWREVSRAVGGGGKTERNIAQPLAVWAALREALHRMTDL